MTPVVELNPATATPAETSAEIPAPPRRSMRGDALIYGMGIVMRRAATLIMLPVYTRLLSPSDYGLLQMLGMTLDVASILMSAGMSAGVMRFYFKESSPSERNRIMATATGVILGLNILGGLLIVLFAGPIHHYVLGNAGARQLIYIAAANFALNEMLTMPMLLMQIEQRPTLFSLTSVVRLVGQLALNIVFLLVLRLGPLGILLSTLITNIVIGGIAMAWMIRKIGVRTSWSAFRDLRRFGVPYQLATAATFVLQFGDRFFLESYRGLAVVGIYGFAYQFGFMLDQMGTGPLMRAWQPRRFADAHLPRARREQDDDKALHMLTIGVVTLGLGMALFVRPALRIIASHDFLEAAGLVPIIVLAFVFQAWGGVVQFGIDAAEKTRYTSYVVWLSAGAIIALYAALIPPFGAYGAAVATLLSFALRGLLLAYCSNRVWPHTYAWGPQLRILLLAIAAAAVCWSVPAAGLVAESLAGALLLALYMAAVWRFAMSADLRAEIAVRARRALPWTRRLAGA
jgi:O-antigen/teichoic acid export membrane protein